MKTKLFSNDGIDPSHARREPDTIYFPDENTQQEIRYLFTTLKSAQNEKDASGAALNIRNLPYSSDLADLASDTQGNLLSFDDVRSTCPNFSTPRCHLTESKCFHAYRLSIVCVE